MSALTLRLTDQEDRDLQLACQQTGKTKSEVVRDLLTQTLHSYRLRQALQSAHAELELQTHCQPRNTSAESEKPRSPFGICAACC